MPAHERTIEIRPACVADSGSLAPLFAQLGYPAEAAVIERRLESVGSDSALLVAVAGSAVVGFVGVGLQRDLITGLRATILGLLVAEGKRNGGVGAALLSAAEDWAFERGASVIVVRSNVIRERAHPFYEREGYRRVKSQHVFEKRKA